MDQRLHVPIGPSDAPAAATALLHREQQVSRLQLLLALPHPPDVLLHGPSCTGKTSIVRQVLAGKPHAYVSCCRSLKLRSLLSSVVSQLAGQGGAKRKRSHAFASAPGTEHSLIWELKAACPADGPSRVLVLDEMQQLLAASEGPLGALLALREQAGVNLCLVMVSRQQPAAQGLLGVLPGVVGLACPAYSDAQLVDILAAAGPPLQSPAAAAAAAAAGYGGSGPLPAQQQQQQLAQLYRRFLANTFVPQFHRLSRCLPDLACQAGALWPKYLAGAAPAGQGLPQQRDCVDGSAQEGDAEVDAEARMYSAVSNRLQAALGSFQPAACCALSAPAAATAATGAASAAGGAEQQQQQQQKRVAAVSGAQMAAGLELSRLSRLLLIAAFLASRNKPSVDRQLFQQQGAGGAGWRGRGGGRRRNVLGADRQAEAAKAAELRGPHTFSLSRLLTIYTNLLAGEEQQAGPASGSGGWRQGGSSGGSSGGSNGGSNGGGAGPASLASASWMGVLRSDVLMGVNTLVAARLLATACDDVLEGPRFSCEAPQELAEQLAMDAGIPLTSYLRYV